MSQREFCRYWLIWAGISIAGFAGCTSPDKAVYQRSASPLSFTGAPKIPVLVGKVEVGLGHQNYSNISREDFRVPPEKIAQLWATERLQNTGDLGTLHYSIKDVDVRSTRTSEGEIIEATLEVQLDIETLQGRPKAGSGTRINSETRITGKPTQSERERILHQMSRDIAAKLDKKLVESFQGVLAVYVGPMNQKTDGKKRATETAKARDRIYAHPRSGSRVEIQPESSSLTNPAQNSVSVTKSAASAKKATSSTKRLVRQRLRNRKPTSVDAWKKGWDWQ